MLSKVRWQFANSRPYTTNNSLCTVTKEVVYPTVYFTRNTIPAKFMDQMYVADFVKSLNKVQNTDISLKTRLHVICNVIYQ